MKRAVIIFAWWFTVFYPSWATETQGPFATREQCEMIGKWVSQVAQERRVRVQVSPCWDDGAR